MKKKRLLFSMLRSEKGTILVGVIVLIVLSAIAFSTALYVLGDAVQRKREADTMNRLRRVEAALFGHPHAFVNDAGANYGYFSRANAVTTTIGNLVDLQDNFASFSSTLDSYGNAIQLDNTAGTYTIYSYGNNGTDDGAAGDDLVITAPTNNRATVDVEVRVLDGEQNPVESLMAGKAYIADDGTNNVIDSLYDGRVLLDTNTVEVDLLPAPNYEVVADNNPDNAVNGVYQWNDVPIGTYLLRVRAATIAGDDNERFDPPWQNSAGGTTDNIIYTPIFVNPTHTNQRRGFNVIYPIVAAVYSLSETGNIHSDQVVTDAGNVVWDALNDPDSDGVSPWREAAEFQSVGNGSPDYLDCTWDAFAGWTAPTRRRMRALLKFNFGSLPDWTINVKVARAQLLLTRHVGNTSLSTYPWTSSPNGTGTVEIWRQRRPWTEVQSDLSVSPGGDPYAQQTGDIDWANVRDQNSDYSDLQDSWAFNADPNHTFEVTEAVQMWARAGQVDGWDNNGFLIKLQNDAVADTWWSFKSCESGRGADDVVGDPHGPDDDALDLDTGAPPQPRGFQRPRLIVSYYE